MGTRRKGRELALQMLFFLEYNPDSPESWQAFWDHHPVDDAMRGFVSRLVRSVLERRIAIDDMIQKNSDHWSLDRMTIIDRSILRLAVGELMSAEKVPPRVIMNEAIEIGKRYGDDKSKAFINGVLDPIVRDQQVMILGEGRD